MKTLHLNLKKKWFDMIVSGEKTEEYREIKEHWVSGLTEVNKPLKTASEYYSAKRSIFNFLTGYKGSRKEAIIFALENNYLSLQDFDTITFSNGFAKDRPQFEVELKSIEINEGNSYWGAEPNRNYFVLKLGKSINKAL